MKTRPRKPILDIKEARVVIKGSLVELKRSCGKANCHCSFGRKHASLYLSRSRKGKTQMVYIPHKYEGMAKEGVKRYKEIIKVMEEISMRNIEIIKNRGKT